MQRFCRDYALVLGVLTVLVVSMLYFWYLPHELLSVVLHLACFGNFLQAYTALNCKHFQEGK